MEKEKIMEFLEGSKEKALDEVLMGLGEVLFGKDFRKNYDAYLNRKKELRLEDVSAAICDALKEYEVPPFEGQRIHSRILKELFPEEENKEMEEAEGPEEMTLESTVDDMLSCDYKDRLVAEHNQLSIRIKNLEKMINESMVSNYPSTLLVDQLKAMKSYMSYLNARARLEKIEEERLWQ